LKDRKKIGDVYWQAAEECEWFFPTGGGWGGGRVKVLVVYEILQMILPQESGKGAL